VRVTQTTRWSATPNAPRNIDPVYGGSRSAAFGLNDIENRP
jgi:hypothetical protein